MKTRVKAPMISECPDHHARFRKMREWRALRDARRAAAREEAIDYVRVNLDLTRTQVARLTRKFW